jgi:SNF2 family DNA or RNA helicase
MIFKPHNYQRAAIDFLLRNRFAGLFADPGLGKTAVTLAMIKQLRKDPRFRGALVIAPLRVAKIVWPAEIQKWDQFRNLTYQILHGPGKYRNIFRKADIYLINVENFLWLFDDETEAWLNALNHRFEPNVLIIDESSKFKNHAARRFKIFKKQLDQYQKRLDQFQRRVILTGTPAPNSMIDLYSQSYLLDKGISLGKFITHYRQKYFYPVNFRNFTEWHQKPGADRVIQQRIAHLTMRIDSKDHLDLPPIVHNQIHIKLPPKAEKIYKQLEQKLFAYVDETPVLLGSAASAYNACRQIANGCLYEPIPLLKPRDNIGNRKTLVLHSAKLDAVQEIVDELQRKPVLIAYHFKHDLKQLLERFGADTPYLGGGVSANKSAKIVIKWNASEIPILFGHPQSIAHGLNLQHGGHDIIWFSLTDNLENYLQFNQRIYRQGVTGQVRVHLIIAERTIDLAILKRLGSKNEKQTALLDAIKEYRDDHN